ncbi:MAG: hypothetical protein H6577_01965 [Lewinellaceae bacterium]|nr:hypothetical protein [Saprospiraceae bacterium]MCB9336873.1 hypothetical protein [Lewinellaceae bacterium]
MPFFSSVFQKKLPDRRAFGVIRYAGAGAMFFAAFTATPWHDQAVTLSGTLLMLTLFYLTVFVFRSRLHWFKILCVLCLAGLYLGSYVYYARTLLEWLPILQKVSLLLNVLLIIGLEYWAEAGDFGQVRAILEG